MKIDGVGVFFLLMVGGFIGFLLTLTLLIPILDDLHSLLDNTSCKKILEFAFDWNSHIPKNHYESGECWR